MTVNRSALLPYSAAQIFDIVNDVTRYPEFLPWCSAANILNQNKSEVVAALSMSISGFSETFTTKNLLTPFKKIEMQLVSGPFRELSGGWTFTVLGEDDGCRVELKLDFHVDGVKSLLGSVFAKAADQMVDAFCQRANSLLR